MTGTKHCPLCGEKLRQCASNEFEHAYSATNEDMSNCALSEIELSSNAIALMERIATERDKWEEAINLAEEETRATYWAGLWKALAKRYRANRYAPCLNALEQLTEARISRKAAENERDALRALIDAHNRRCEEFASDCHNGIACGRGRQGCMRDWIINPEGAT